MTMAVPTVCWPPVVLSAVAGAEAKEGWCVPLLAAFIGAQPKVQGM
jgi:hypothetical protein